MTFPTVVGTTDFHSSSAATSTVITLPDGSNVSGRLLIIAFNLDGVTALGWPGSPTVFTDLNSGDDGAGRSRAEIRYRIVDGGEGWDGTGDTITVTHPSEQRCWYVWLIDDWHGTTPPEAAAATGVNTHPDSPNLDPSGWGTEDTLWIALEFNDGADSTTTYPTNYSAGQHNGSSSASGGGVHHGVARRELNAASDNPVAWVDSNSSNSSRAVTIAIRPGEPPPPEPEQVVVMDTAGW